MRYLCHESRRVTIWEVENGTNEEEGGGKKGGEGRE